MKKLAILLVLLAGCSFSSYEAKKETLEREINILKLELRKTRLERILADEEKKYDENKETEWGGMPHIEHRHKLP